MSFVPSENAIIVRGIAYMSGRVITKQPAQEGFSIRDTIAT